ncbi:MAG: TIR domain-containing protein [Campylobacteraceae bacterium]|nr:TIR domain-containing protein [Campylobacteraceae bacterium]
MKGQKINIKLKKPFKESMTLFENLQTQEDVANFFEVEHRYLMYLAYKDKRPHYKELVIPKKTGGTRKISKPVKSIDILQKKLLPFLQEKYKIKKPVHGFVKGKSILTNSQQHLKKKFILNIDLKDFYDSIHFGRIKGLFMSETFKMGENAATLVAHLCCNNTKIPQGACTSPILSNFIVSQLDKKLMEFAKTSHCTYTRYADDITLSSSKNISNTVIKDENSSFPINGFELSSELEKLIHFCNFTINYKKVRLESKYIRQEVTGITVNDFPNVKRTFIRQIRAMLHSWEKDGLDIASQKHLSFKKREYSISSPEKFFKNVIIGKLAYLKMIRGEEDIILRKLCLKFTALVSNDEVLPKFIRNIKMKYEEFQVFICHASEDKEKIARPLYDELVKLGIKSFLDEKYIEWGDSLTEKINHALGQSRYVIAILSDNSIEKKWPKKEINSTLSREISGDKVLLPILAGDERKIFKVFPLLHDKLYKLWNNDAKFMANEIKNLLSSTEDYEINHEVNTSESSILEKIKDFLTKIKILK